MMCSNVLNYVRFKTNLKGEIELHNFIAKEEDKKEDKRKKVIKVLIKDALD